jgi:hypothetical protein
MTVLDHPRVLLKCKVCKVTFVPELEQQNKCNNCLVREEIEAKIKSRIQLNVK